VNALVHELSRRRVIRVAGTYAFIAWIIVQVADAMLPAMRLPDWALSLVLYLLVLGFPITLVLAWAFDVDRGGIVVTPESSSSRMTPQRATILSLVALGATSGLFFLLQFTTADVSAIDQFEASDHPVGDSLAVLPFSDLSQDGGQDWLGRGIAEEILAELSGAQGLQVAVGTETDRIGSGGRGVRVIGTELGVANVLDGSIRRVGDRVRVSVRLLDVRNGFVVFSQSYDGSLDDVFELQNQIAAAIVADLERIYELQPSGLEAEPSTAPELAPED
jgi:TolB-like protein